MTFESDRCCRFWINSDFIFSWASKTGSNTSMIRLRGRKKYRLSTSNSMIPFSLPNHDRPPNGFSLGNIHLLYPRQELWRLDHGGCGRRNPPRRGSCASSFPNRTAGALGLVGRPKGHGPVGATTEGSHTVCELYARSTLGGSLRRCKHTIAFTNIIELANEAIHWVSYLRRLMRFIYNLFSNLHPPTPATGSGPKLWVPGSARQPLADLPSRRR